MKPERRASRASTARDSSRHGRRPGTPWQRAGSGLGQRCSQINERTCDEHHEQAQQRAAARTRWSVDPERTTVDFAVKTFWGLATVRGRFDRFDGAYDVGPDSTSDRAHDRR